MSTYEPDDWSLTNGTWGTDADVETAVTGAITAFANAGGGQVTVTSAGHSVLANMYVRVTGTTNYDGEYVATNIAADTFEITATWVATETGTWHTNQSGDAHLLFEDTTPASDPTVGLRQDKMVEVAEGTPYLARGVVEADSVAGGNTVRLGIVWHSKRTAWLSTSIVSAAAVLPAVGTWYILEGIVDAPAGARYGSPQIRKANTAFHVACDLLGLRQMPVAFSAYLNSDTSYAIGATFVYDQENFDYGSNYDTSNGRFTAPVAGVYTFHAQARAEDLSAGNYCNLQLQVNGTSVAGGQRSYCHQNFDDPIVTLSTTKLLARGDYVTITYIHDYGGARTVKGVSGSYQYTTFEGYRVQ